MSSRAGGRRRSLGLALVGLGALALPFLVRSPYQMHLAIMLCINIMLAMSFAMLFSAGLITIGAASFWAVGAYTSAFFVMDLDMSFWLALPLAGLCAGVIALVLGSILVRAPGVAFVVQTMVINMIVVQALGQIEALGGWGGILGIPRPDPIGTLKFVGKTHFYYLVLSLLGLNSLAFFALYSSRIGRAWSAIRLNPRLAQTLGISLFRYRLLAFVIASISSGVAGSFYAHYFGTIEPGTFSVFKSIYIQIYGILGGLNFYLMGPVVGACIMTLLPEFLRVSKEIEPILTGAILILLVIFLPGGVLSIPERVSSWTEGVMKRGKGSPAKVQ